MNINMATSFLMVIPHMLESKSHATARDAADEGFQLQMYCLYVLLHIWFLLKLVKSKIRLECIFPNPSKMQNKHEIEGQNIVPW